jgi:hypothetical protein
MESAHLQRQQCKNEPVAGDVENVRAKSAAVSLRPLSLRADKSLDVFDRTAAAKSNRAETDARTFEGNVNN